jgi:zeta-carotene desaturase
LPGRATQWLFRKPGEDGREHVHAVISGADAWMALDEATIVERVLDDMAWALPRVRGLAPVAVRAVKEKRATFGCVPGIDRLRPKAVPDPIAGGIPNLFLAGDWTATGWPATMEGAVRSGYAAAAACTGQGGIVADVPPGRVAAWLGLRA